MYLVFDLGATHMRVAWSEDGRRFSRIERQETNVRREGFAEFVDFITTHSKRYSVNTIVGGVPGEVDGQSGELRMATNLPEWIGLPVRRSLEEATGAEVAVLNDAALAGLGEAAMGAGRASDIVAYMTISTGVNGSRIVRGQIEPSAYGFEIGQQLVSNGQGAMVSLESLVGGAATQRMYHKAPKTIHDARVWKTDARYLAQGLYNTVLHWSPDVVVLNGPMMHDISLGVVEQEFRRLGQPLGAWPAFALAELGDEAGLYGALVYAKQLD